MTPFFHFLYKLVNLKTLFLCNVLLYTFASSSLLLPFSPAMSLHTHVCIFISAHKCKNGTPTTKKTLSFWPGQRDIEVQAKSPAQMPPPLTVSVDLGRRRCVVF